MILPHITKPLEWPFPNEGAYSFSVDKPNYEERMRLISRNARFNYAMLMAKH